MDDSSGGWLTKRQGIGTDPSAGPDTGQGRGVVLGAGLQAIGWVEKGQNRGSNLVAGWSWSRASIGDRTCPVTEERTNNKGGGNFQEVWQGPPVSGETGPLLRLSLRCWSLPMQTQVAGHLGHSGGTGLGFTGCTALTSRGTVSGSIQWAYWFP